MKATIKGYITYQENSYGNKKPLIDFMRFDPRKDPGIWGEMAVVCEHSFEIEIPNDFDPRPDLIAQLKAQEKKAKADFQVRINEIHKRISELQAIEHTA